MSRSPKQVLAQQCLPPLAGHSVGADGVLPWRGLRNRIRGGTWTEARQPAPSDQMELADPVGLLTEYIITSLWALSSFSFLPLKKQVWGGEFFVNFEHGL